ncbi:hypothetical protein TNCV_4870961 [Trichonephila clavipes]|nr:hypothetical protein TNCV_4870961 [Trichonephila clavipes]
MPYTTSVLPTSHGFEWSVRHLADFACLFRSDEVPLLLLSRGCLLTSKPSPIHRAITKELFILYSKLVQRLYAPKPRDSLFSGRPVRRSTTFSHKIAITPEGMENDPNTTEIYSQQWSGASDGDRFNSCQVIYSQFGLAIHQNDHQARRRFVQWAQNEIAVVPDFHKRILFSDEAHFWLNGYVNKQNCRIWSEANPQVYVETPLHPKKLTVWCALWAGGILLQKR